jgi:hypothetical protein
VTLSLLFALGVDETMFWNQWACSAMLSSSSCTFSLNHLIVTGTNIVADVAFVAVVADIAIVNTKKGASENFMLLAHSH